LGGHNFFNSILILSALDVPIREVQVLFGNLRNNEALPLSLACPEHLSVQSLTNLSFPHLINKENEYTPKIFGHPPLKL